MRELEHQPITLSAVLLKAIDSLYEDGTLEIDTHAEIRAKLEHYFEQGTLRSGGTILDLALLR